MKSKQKFEILFICLLIIISGGLLYIFLSDPSKDNYFPNIVKDLHTRTEYEIIDKIEECTNGYEEIYKDNEYIYYFDCNKSNFIYLEWQDGSITTMKEELNSGNVSIESLIDHGLDCQKKLINDDNSTNEEDENVTENKTNEN